MRLIVKLYAGLSQFLPPAATGNIMELDTVDDMTPAAIIEQFKLPPELVHIVLLNGVYIKPEERSDIVLQDGDTLAMWPPVAGG
jgi:molybdopterin converting factor small subunit